MKKKQKQQQAPERRARRSFTPEFKVDAVRLTKSGKTITQVARGSTSPRRRSASGSDAPKRTRESVRTCSRRRSVRSSRVFAARTSSCGSRFGVWRWLTAFGLAAACGPASTRPSGPEAYEIEWWVTRLTPEPREDADLVVQNEGDDVCEFELGERSDDGVVQWRAITLAGGTLSSGAELTIPTVAPGAYFLRATSCARRRATSEVHYVDASQVASAKLRIGAASR